MELANRAKELLISLEYINIATVSPECLPWSTPVYAKHDDNLIFYWSSWKEAEHSKNIRSKENVFITLYDSTRKRGENNRRCLYIEAKAFEIDKQDEIERICKFLYENESIEYSFVDFMGDGLKRLYRAQPQKMWLNDISEREVTRETIKMRVEVPLEQLL